MVIMYNTYLWKEIFFSDISSTFWDPLNLFIYIQSWPLHTHDPFTDIYCIVRLMRRYHSRSALRRIHSHMGSDSIGIIAFTWSAIDFLGTSPAFVKHFSTSPLCPGVAQSIPITNLRMSNSTFPQAQLAAKHILVAAYHP